MTEKAFYRELNLSEESLAKIKASVHKAESGTSGEIAVAVAAESSDYAFWELFYAIIAAFVVFSLALPFAGSIRAFYEKLNWSAPEWYLPGAYGLAVLLLIFFFYIILNIPALDRLIIPQEYKKRMVTERALRCFTECGVYVTEKHCGVLIFVSFLERQVRIIADTGISEKIGNDLWAIIADGIVEEISKGNVESAFIDAVEKCGDILSEKYPSDGEKQNELSDGLIIF